MLHTIPGYSQYLDVKDTWWQSRACGIVSLKMVIDYAQKTTVSDSPTIAQLIEEGTARDGRIPEIGWKHAILAELATLHGFSGKNFDWSALAPHAAWEVFLSHLERGPVIASIHRNLRTDEPGHLITVYGFKNEIVHYHDPDAKVREEIPRHAPLPVFLNGWKGRAIVVKRVNTALHFANALEKA